MIFRLEPDRTLASKHLSGRKKNKEWLSIALCANANRSYKLNPLVIQNHDALKMLILTIYQWLIEAIVKLGC